jgi:hypothetical protein
MRFCLPKKKYEILVREDKKKKKRVLEIAEPVHNRFNCSGLQFFRSNHRIPGFRHFFKISSFFKETGPDQAWSPVQPAGPVWFLKPWFHMHRSEEKLPHEFGKH